MMLKLIKSAARILGGVACVVLGIWIVVAQPVLQGNHPSGVSVAVFETIQSMGK